MRSFIWIVVICLVVGFIALNYNQSSTELDADYEQGRIAQIKSEAAEQAKIAAKKAEETAKLAAQKAEEQAKLAAKKAEEQAKLAAAKAEEAAKLAAKKAEEQAKLAASKLAEETKAAAQTIAQAGITEKLADLIAKAKSYLAEGKYQEAITTAQSALKQDPNSQEAKGIVETAKQKIAAAAGEKADAFKTAVGEKTAGAAAGALGSLGE